MNALRRLGVVIGLLALLGGGTAVLYVESGPILEPVDRSVISVVAAENFWGDLAAQVGGARVHVLSIVSDPNADPHDYESNTSDAVAVSSAALVIENGAGYDDWCAHLLSSAAAPGPIVLNVAELLGRSQGANPHFWYNASYVNTTIAGIFRDLVGIDPANASYFEGRYAALNASFAPVWSLDAQIRATFGGTPIAATEDIVQYLAWSTGLDLISPVPFMQAVAEGNDPSAASVTTFEDQLTGGNVSVLVYNAQTVTPLTDQMRAIATAHHVGVVAVTETLHPGGASFEQWMGTELIDLQAAVVGSTHAG